MIVDENIHSFLVSKYNKVNQIKRIAVEDESGETTVELYFKVFNLYLVPNAKYFNMNKMIKKSNLAKDHERETNVS